MSNYAIEMLNITKRFPGIIANDNITLQLKKGEIHASCIALSMCSSKYAPIFR